MRRWTFTTMLAGLACAIAVSGPLLAQAQAPQGGSPAEARAMLEHAVQALHADKQKALTEFTQATKDFRHRDLYVFCFGPDGAIDAHPNAALIGVEASQLKDKDGKAFALEILRVAKPGSIAEVTYSWPRLLSDEPIRKTSYVTRIDDQVCGVGYYH
jgi:signal transduction histidine kinase